MTLYPYISYMKHTTLAIIPQSHLVSSNYSCCGLIVLRWIASIMVFMAHCKNWEKKPKRSETINRRNTDNTIVRRTNNYLQSSTLKTKDWETRTPQNTGNELRCPRRLNSRVTLVTNPVISHEWKDGIMITINVMYPRVQEYDEIKSRKLSKSSINILSLI
jgi:hypothetical protein